MAIWGRRALSHGLREMQVFGLLVGQSSRFPLCRCHAIATRLALRLWRSGILLGFTRYFSSHTPSISTRDRILEPSGFSTRSHGTAGCLVKALSQRITAFVGC